ncbi:MULTISPECIES: sterol desaturase family protein [Reichenbachiella]|uniref:Fatty acid hydroxylase superfamily protein n=1 Tax=Reichenbachiella agariperforans TaxID=156994 RepID=A0A1M6UVR3_REIAG|nr:MULTISPECIES: sterol desaturase family protein [Reichenbachiella]MBU2912449.1 sterol desaturase family protein [Reichenbachiella agariperforans]RJE72683.1 fatty acid hydroxylase [Reichenbachiella sp. MSK19-1]SHK73340.1 Fatty acid hydroxylase superfamily protein [Reichenbachiella agariperforans]
MPKTSGSGRIFKNPVLEKLTRTHIAAPLVAFSAVSTYLLYQAVVAKGIGGLQVLVWFLGGLLLYSLVEYIMHRFVFHMPETTPARKKFVYTAHGVHHDFPRDKDRLAMPVPVSLALSAILFFVFRFAMGDFVYAFLPGILMGYASYLWVHYMVHAFQPPKNAFKIWWVHHGIHHYKQPHRAFGVSTPLWDIIFGTMPEQQK